MQAEAPTHIETGQYNPCNNSSNKSQAPEDGCWTVNNEIIKQVTSSWSLFIQLTLFVIKDLLLCEVSYLNFHFNFHLANKDTSKASIVGDKHKPDSIGITWIRMLPDNLYNFISVRPPSFIFELFCGPNSSYWALAAGIFNRQNIPKCFKIFFWPHALKLHCNFVLCNNYRVILLGKTIFLLSTESNIGTSWYCGCEMYDWLGL